MIRSQHENPEAFCAEFPLNPGLASIAAVSGVFKLTHFVKKILAAQVVLVSPCGVEAPLERNS